MDEQPPSRSRSSLLPIVLIAVGVLVLVGNLGVFDWGYVLRVVDLWPVVLLAVGIDMLSRGRYRTYVVVGALVLGGLFYAAERGVGGPFGGVAARTHAIDHPLDGARDAEVRIEGGVGNLRVDGFSDGDALVRGTIVTGRGEVLVDRFERRGSTAVLELGTRRARPFGPIAASRDNPWELSLRRGLPLDLEIGTGVGGSTLDLQGLALRDLDIDSGVGNLELRLPATGTFRASIDAGVGNVTIRVPEGLAARIGVDTGIGRVHVDPSFERVGNVYESSGFAGAAHRVELQIDGGIGAVTVERVR